MPIEQSYSCAAKRQILKDWTRHYVSKGCNDRKASNLAMKKARQYKPCPFVN